MTDPVKIIVGEGDITEVQVPEYGIIQTGGGGGGGSDGATFFPEVSQEGVISWTNDGGYDNPEPVNIKGPAGNDGSDGQNGVTFTPSVSGAGIISWTNDGDLPNPSPANIKGSDGEDGEDGVSPAVTFGEITGGHTMTVTDKTHPTGQTINIMDGEDGSAGTDGTTFTPSVDSSGNLSWTNDGGKQNPPTVNIKGPAGTCEMTILSYGSSTWADFIAAYNSNSIVYCRASSAADPSSGSQTRLAFMAYVNSETSPTSVEFQYYRSVSSHTDAQQGDQVFIYKLTNAGTWTVTVRDAFTKVVAGTNMTSSYANGTLTLNATGGGGGTSDYDALSNRPSINGTTLSGNKTAAELGLGTYSKPSAGIPQTDLAQTVQNKLDNTVVVSDTQPTASENKLWVDTDAGAGTSYQIPTVAEMEAADAQVAALIDSKHIPVWPTLTRYNSVQDVVDVMSDLPTNSVLLNTFGNTLRTDLFDTASSYDGFIVCFKASGNNIYYLAYSRDVAAIGNINIPNVSVTYKHSLL